MKSRIPPQILAVPLEFWIPPDPSGTVLIARSGNTPWSDHSYCLVCGYMKFISVAKPLEIQRELPVRRTQIFISACAASILALCALVQYVLFYGSVPPGEVPVSPARVQPANLK